MRVMLFAAARAQAGAATLDISVPDGARVDALLRCCAAALFDHLTR